MMDAESVSSEREVLGEANATRLGRRDLMVGYVRLSLDPGYVVEIQQ